MEVSKKRMDKIIQKLRGRDYRVTPQRLEIIRILCGSKEHPDVEQIFDQVKVHFPTTSLATVYKTINVLKEIGEVMEMGFGDGRNRYDGYNPKPHPHLVCTECRKILDPDLEKIGGLTDALAKKTGFRIVSHRLDFFGVCPECQKQGAHA